jgi:hypothetical protein
VGRLTVTGEGEVTLSPEMLAHLGIEPGGQRTVEKLAGGGLRIYRRGRTGSIADVFGTLKREDIPPLSVEEINDWTAKGWAGEE